MNIIIEPNGNLTFIADSSLASLTDMLATHNDNDLTFLADMLESEGYSTNGSYTTINPEDVAALTDAPMFSDEVNVADDGTVEVIGSVWWFPNYMVENFAKTLVETGRVTFTKALA